MTYQFLESEAVKLWNLLGFGPDRMAEMRCIDMRPDTPKDKKCMSRVTTTGLAPFLQWCREWNGKGNCFVGRNARKLDHTSQVKDITCISIDIDPIREKDVAATPEQTEEAVNAGRKLLEVYKDRLRCDGSLAMSGNGALVLWTTENPVSVGADFERKIGMFQRECSEILLQSNFKGVKVDATQDSARLIKCVGTVSVKGGIRITRFLHVAGGRGNGDGLFSFVGGLRAQAPLDQGALLAKSGYPSRSEADFALAMFMAKSGAAKDDIVAALGRNPIGRNDRHDDHVRIADKVLARVANEGVAAAPNNVGGGDDLILHTPQSSLEAYRETVQRRKKYEKPELPTGFESLDRATHGLRRGEIYTVAGRPGVGKSCFLLNVANTLLSGGKRVLVLSTEMAFYQIWDRIFAIGCDTPSNDILRGAISPEQRVRVEQYWERFKSFDFHVCDLFQPNIEQVTKAVNDAKPDVLMFDHIQHVGDDWKLLAEFTRGLKRLAMRTNCAVVAASQLTRPAKVMDFKTKEVHEAPPRLADLKGCGTIEEESAFVLLLHRSKESVDQDTPIVEANLAKNRFGPHVGEEFAFMAPWHKFKALKEV